MKMVFDTGNIAGFMLIIGYLLVVGNPVSYLREALSSTMLSPATMQLNGLDSILDYMQHLFG